MTLTSRAGELSNFVFIETYEDGVSEDLEGFIIMLDLLESALDPRDVDYVSIPRSVFIVRINDTGMELNVTLS